MGVVKNFIVRAGADFSDLEKKMQTTSKKMKTFGKNMQSVGKGFTSAITVPAIAAVGGLAAVAVSAGKAADELITTANKTGLSTTALQELEYAARFVDVEVETMTDSMFRLTKGMDQARKGTGEQADAFKKLNVRITNADGSLRDSKDVWADTIDALGAVGNEAERDALSYKLFGRSAQELNPLIKAGGAELKRLGQEAQDLGIIMSEDGVSSLGAFDDSMQRLQASLGGAKNQIAIALLPTLERLIPIIQDKVVPGIIKFSKKIGELIEKFSKLDPWQQKAILAFGLLAIAIGPLLTVTGKLIFVFGNLIPLFGKMAVGSKAVGVGMGTAAVGTKGLTAAMAVMFGPAGWIVIGIGLFTSLLLLMNKFSKQSIETSNTMGRMELAMPSTGADRGSPTGGRRYVKPSDLGGTVTPLGKNSVDHTGTITVKGVSNSGDLVATTKIIADNLSFDLARGQRRNR